MPDVPVHPTAQALALFGNGQLPEAQAARVAAHLETCADCRRAVASLPPDSFLGKVRAARPGPPAVPPGPTPTRPGASLGVMSRPPAPAASPANVPPELANHPKFRVVRELGRGGMGVIYLAEHRVLEKPVALKVINPAVLDNPEALARFHAEARAAARLDHPNIARAHDADQAGQLHFLVLEYVEGQSLAQLLERKGPLSITSACQCVRQAALGLQHAFEQGMVHRDIKPQNLMLTPKGLVKVLDFGLARLRGEGTRGPRLTQLDAFMGTPEYVAPEQATDARSADTRADIYSLGCTLYALLTGRPPFQEDTVVKAVLAHIEKEAKLLHQVRPDVPPELSAVVAKMLAKDPAQRYQRPIDVAQALVPFIKAGGKPSVVGGAPVSPGVPAVGEEGAPFTNLERAPAPTRAPRKATKGREAANPAPAPWWKRPRVLAGAGAAALALAVGAWLLAGVVSKPGETRSATTARGTALAGVFSKPGETIPDSRKVAEDKGGKPQAAGTSRSSTELSSAKGAAGASQPLPGTTLTNSIGMKFAWIPPGKFRMGGDTYGDEKPVHRVTITKGFYIGVYPVTQAEWKKVMDNDNPSYFRGADLPVENVSWDDCQTFCGKLRQRDGECYSLPTEAEWEYACRAGTDTEYYTGDGEDALKKAGWYSGNSGSWTHTVGQLAKNSWGLYDMHGNVRQWCQDGYAPYPAGDVEDQKGPENPDYCAVRGGSWFSNPEHCRAAFRSRRAPGGRDKYVGCRVCFRLD